MTSLSDEVRKNPLNDEERKSVDEARKSVLETLDALRQWSDEIKAANDRGLTKTFDRIAAAEGAMGWPDHATTSHSVPPGEMHYFLLFNAVRETLQKSTKLQTDVIDKVAEACYASRLV
jgi:hypothetical protein